MTPDVEEYPLIRKLSEISFEKWAIKDITVTDTGFEIQQETMTLPLSTHEVHS